jgi:hypothetical protein
MGSHIAEERSQIGELLPSVAGHLVEQRALSVHDLVVRERQHEVLAPRVEETERQMNGSRMTGHPDEGAPSGPALEQSSCANPFNDDLHPVRTKHDVTQGRVAQNRQLDLDPTTIK